MADYEGSLPIKTARDDDTKIILVDGASGDTATKKLSIAGVGDAVSAGVNDFGVPVLGKDASGNYILLSLSATGETIVSATNLDIRDLAFATDKVDVGGSVVALDAGTLAALETIELGATTLSALENITVSATDLDIRDLTHVSDSVKVGDGADFLAISAAGEASVEITNAQGTDGAAAPSDTLQVGGKDGAGNLQSFKTDTTGAVFVIPVVAAGIAKVCDYQTTATVGANATSTHDYVVTDTKTFSGKTLLVGARGATKVQFGYWNGTVFTVKGTYFQQIQDNKDHIIDCLSLLGDATAAIRVVITNLDGASSDVYSTLQGTEE